MKILWNAEPIEKVLGSNIPPDYKRKLRLILEVKKFCETELGLVSSNNYSNYSALEEKYVSYVVNASPAYSLEPYLWSYPLVGDLSYKGYPRKADAIIEQEKLIEQGLDTHLRGVSAYSTLGWFNDPVLSSMMNYSEPNLVDLIIHESVHEHLYIKSNANFNEQLANFFAKVGTQIFYKQRDPKVLKQLDQIEEEQKLFREFMTMEKKALAKKYKEIEGLSDADKQNEKKQWIEKLVKKYQSEIAPRLQLSDYSHLINGQLNNAKISLFGTYSDNQELFQELYIHLGATPEKFLLFFKDWEDEEKPIDRLKTYAKSIVNPD